MYLILYKLGDLVGHSKPKMVFGHCSKPDNEKPFKDRKVQILGSFSDKTRPRWMTGEGPFNHERKGQSEVILCQIHISSSGPQMINRAKIHVQKNEKSFRPFYWFESEMQSKPRTRGLLDRVIHSLYFASFNCYENLWWVTGFFETRERRKRGTNENKKAQSEWETRGY